MAKNHDIFGIREKKKIAKNSGMASEYGEEVANSKIAAREVAKKVAEKAAETSAKEMETEQPGGMTATIERRRRANPSITGDTFGVTVPDGPKEKVALKKASIEDVFGSPKKKKEEE